MNDYLTAALHDIKNHLAELALRLGNRPDTQQEMRIAMHAAHALTEVLLVYRHTSGSLSANIDHVNAIDFLDTLAADYRSLFPELNLSINQQDAPDFAFFDKSLVRLALGNAIHNACRYAKQNIELTVYLDNHQLVLQVQDDGPGFPENQLQNDFSQPSSVSGSGTGLGLYLSYKIASIHQLGNQTGNIILDNTPQGARFRMLLPE